ncbi:NAD(P)-dependent dehydrogenase (short-subunit alcohol dehydrogenase family) [Paenibacillus phyllosphaerae]|uniref:NAD(P)-dependent dehydrogenase (Short-subunit alcohol dehydrogenase family) n=1 Tax=Paenibacillus phyllosphaerae TaxID=274593 RepID=A0A7W5B0E4_9BACL|nr:SDR family oxidoreductase [Paenibacillus phyllosphaerae]MBB3111601.1 NAD(P)-dependent dehydrogenase (short-subunit alcohol dehydrogenase family) [Paenibacillus phyllosphaerae]
MSTTLDESRKIAVVTGASGGMGRATAALLAAKHGMKVYLIARHSSKGMDAVHEVNRQSGRNDAELILCDLASISSIRQAAAQLTAACSHIDVLVNNAGVVTTRREVTEDGFERQLGVNHLGHFVLTGLLLPLLKRSRSGRIVVVSSGAHKIGRMNYEDPGMEKRFTIWGAYGRSKLANIWFVKELARRLAGSNVTVNALHPGAVSTDIGVDRRTGFGKLVHRLLRPFFLTPEQGSATAVYLAASPAVEGKSGAYYYRSKPAPTSKLAQEAEAAQRFWAWSEEVTGFEWVEQDPS